ncbi:cysteine-rich receptor-like protein kinase 25 [Morus notabilis]|uniref:cysteine-rich receptor-like protein kinase 25 n=1 Tax=Morus notabilis TaxID=981085 RepID=UPI000CECEF60|nr:cysteine-rich receptor-like protein kinase 25 [Morus notabilis]
MLSLLFLSLLLSLALKSEPVPTYTYHSCPNTTTFAPNSTYQSNLNSLLSSLSSNATSREHHNATAGGRDPSTVSYGLFFCRGDVGTKDCRECVQSAVEDVRNRCPVEKDAIIWYEQCQLRYSNLSFFGALDETPTIYLWNTADITEKERFNQLVEDTLNEATAEAAKGRPGGEKFAMRTANFSRFQKLYGLVQCSPDLSSEDCNRCLQDSVSKLPSCCYGKFGGRVISPCCNIRYEVYPFFNLTAISPPPSTGLTPPPPSNTIAKQNTEGESDISYVIILAIVVPIAVCTVLLILAICILRRRAKQHNSIEPENVGDDEITTIESLHFDFAEIEAATNKFSLDCKLGEGGFGEVYKGTLANGQEIAVKRLSKSSGQGVEEFKNEVLLLAKLQHRNLVRLFGFCFEGEEKLLVYEFVPNRSLDNFLYDPNVQRQLDWAIRYKIIGGIARGIMYLHEDSRLRIIHRDLKASNILLDDNMSPKISDFGMARIFDVDQTRGNTSKIVGTYGYMSPEYAMHGQFSVKSDVYSFGVLVLEIISGKKNSSFYESDRGQDLLSYAWKLWKAGTPLDFVDPKLESAYSEDEVLRCVQIGLLCVQEDPEDRPTMTTVVLMFNSYSVTPGQPQQPAFYVRTSEPEHMMPAAGLNFDHQSTSNQLPLSVNEASITDFYPR